MTVEQKLQKDYYSTQAGLEFLRKMQEECEKDRCLIIDSIDREEDKKGFMEANKLTMNCLLYTSFYELVFVYLRHSFLYTNFLVWKSWYSAEVLKELGLKWGKWINVLIDEITYTW